MSGAAGTGLSAAQEAAVVDERPQVMVTAAAGSGKTRLLVASVVRALVEEDLPVERLVAVTFTRKAGAELASRVREALEGCGREDLAGSLDAAALGTIDSLCRRLVKDQALEADVDPTCGVLEAETAELIKTDVMTRAWETTVQRADEAQLRVLSAQGRRFRADVMGIYDRLRALGQEAPRIAIPSGVDGDAARERLSSVVREALAAGAEQPKQSASLANDLETLRSCLAWLEGPVEAREGETGLRSTSGSFPSRRTRAMEEPFALVRQALTEYRCALAESLLRPLADVVNVLLDEFHRAYQAAKSEHGLMDFADLELKARGLLISDDGDRDRASVPMRGAFLLVDEFQDTNELQCTILSGLGAERVLMVGDERQSIYRFRGADVEVFRTRQEALRREGNQSETGGLHRLDVNYRSSFDILRFVNRVFAAPDFFGEGFAHLQADPEREPMRPVGRKDGSSPSMGTVAPIRVLVASRRTVGEEERRQVSMRQAEAEALATEVRRLVREEGWRQRDVVVLLPTHMEVESYRAALLAEGIDVYVVRGKGYYMQEEVTDVTGLLRLLVAPHDDLALLSVLRSPLVGLSDDGLYLLGRERRQRRADSLWEVVREGEAESLAATDREALDVLRQRIGQLRPRVGRPGLSRLIDDAVTLFGYDLCLLGAPEGRVRFANVRKLMRLAAEYESATGPDLAGFLAVVKSMEQVSDHEGSAPTLGESEDVVRVMTIHQAKGLEFPVVVLAGLGADAHRPKISTFVVGNDGRVAMFLKGYRNDTYEEYDPCWGPAVELAEDEARREREEDVRLMYVAMTRAQERLVLVGGRPTRNAMNGSRIGRIVKALGLSALPEGGESVSLEDSVAEVAGVEPEGPSPVPGGRGAEEETTARGVGAQAVPSSECSVLEGMEVRPFFPEVPARISFSSLSAYERCPRRFYLERVLGLSAENQDPREDESGCESGEDSLLDLDEEGSGRDVGILVHQILERFSARPTRPTEDEVREVAADGASTLGMALTVGDSERAVKLALAAWESVAGERLRSSSAESEAPFFFATDGVVVTGIMDLLFREPECWFVIDYKTNALKDRSVEEVAEPYSLQCALYGLAALKAGAPAVEMNLVFLERPEHAVSIRYAVQDIPRLEEEFSKAFGGIREGVFPRKVGVGCEWCPVAWACRSMVAD